MIEEYHRTDTYDTATEIAESIKYFGRVHRPVQSHRAPRKYSIRRSIVIVLVIGVSGTVITTEATSTPDSHSAVISASVPVLNEFEADTIRAEIEHEIPKLVEERARTTVSATSRRADRPAPPKTQPSKIEIVIRFALSQQGDPYVWAASGPNAYDCSGLLLRSFAQVGIQLPHFTGALISKGTRVSESQMKRGDIVFPASGHVGIYLGNGQFVHASSGKGKVIVAKLYSFHAARRLI